MRPIGYWLKELDRLIEAGFEQELGTAGLTRRQWQVLNALPGTQEEVDRTMAPFLPTTAPVIDTLVEAGWASRGSTIELTAAGLAHRTETATQVDRLRAKVVTGISDDEYAAAVRTLERMAANLSP
ncbi:MarR family winged helix-turn-helix transcriptional regulator [Actinokineospora enzanensis]|uniref:MarR family winged helix-turn-helix transcriptional regulator n=1 Tax=Actinokineospora enzanensis TaxID=155975 RepID=UPI00036ED8B1|nr:MarR family winged helix-turn-helix transcriptional regulator [Actinokineospora enzanensis]